VDGSICARASTSKSNKHSNYVDIVLGISVNQINIVDIVPGISVAVESQLGQTIVEQQPTNNCILACENKMIFTFVKRANIDWDLVDLDKDEFAFGNANR